MNTLETQSDDTSILMIDRNGVIVDARENTRSSLGYERGQLVNKRMSELLEFGGDLLMERLHENSSEGFSVLTLVRKQDKSCIPTTAQIRPMPDNCFAVAFDDLPNEIPDRTQAPKPQPKLPNRALLDSLPPVRLADIAPPLPKPESRGDTALRYRNILLHERPIVPEVAQPVLNAVQPNPVVPPPLPNVTPVAVQSPAPVEVPASQLESAAEERRRLEARVNSLSDQLQQLHAQLQGNLESERISQMKLREREVQLLAAEQSQAAAEGALADERTKRENFEAQFHAAQQSELAAKDSLAREQKHRHSLEAQLIAAQQNLSVAQDVLANEQKQRESVLAKLADAEKNEAAAKEALDYESKQRETLQARLSAAEQAETAIKEAVATEQKQRAAIEQELSQIKSAQAQLDADHAVQLANEQKQREVLQEELAQIKTAQAQLEADRAAKQQQWLVKLKAVLSDLDENDRRLAKEIETRCALQTTLQALHQEFSSQS